MDIIIVHVGKTKASFLHEGIQEYLKRLKHFANIIIHETKEAKSKNTILESINTEGEFIIEKINKLPFNTIKIGLAVEGKSVSSKQFAHYIEERRDESKSLCFIIGGVYGLSEKVKRQCDVLLSFSELTFTHEMIRLLLLEQLYRAATIIENKPYHY
jgi:23S rRNA (pseudouridine1915-N3)-methyltransferase